MRVFPMNMGFSRGAKLKNDNHRSAFFQEGFGNTPSDSVCAP